MPVGLLTLELHIADAQSLKDKRQVLRSLKDRLRAHFNVAVAELDFEDTWQRSVVGVVTLSNEEHHVEEALQKVLAEADKYSVRVGIRRVAVTGRDSVRVLLVLVGTN